MGEKLKSRKFWITFGTGVLLLFAQQLGLDIAPETVWGIVAMVTGYNAGQGYVDGQRARAKSIVVNNGYSADRHVDPIKVVPPKGGDAVQKPGVAG